MEHADWLNVLRGMDAITANSDISLSDSQHDVINLLMRGRLIAYSLGNIDLNSMGDYPIINAPQGVQYHFILPGMLLLSEPNEVKSFRNEWQQSEAFIEKLALSDEQLAMLIPGLGLRAGPTRADRIDSLKTAFAMGQIAVVITRDSMVVPKRKGPEDLPVEEYTPKPYTLGPHEEPGYVPPENPHSGLHNREELTPDFNTSVESFKTTRQVDMKNLSPEDDVARKALKVQGWGEDKIEEVLTSGDQFTLEEMDKGDKLYGFITGGRDISTLDNKAYWLDKNGFGDVEAEFFRQGHWDREGVKGYLALPCFNRANDMITVELTESQTVVKSTIGKATELLKYTGENGYTTGTLGKIMGGGGTQISPNARKLTLISGK